MSSKPKNCSKVKNACKYCLQQVNNKNGLQCQGACKKWAHYKCLSYTPGKVSDIKAGIIKVMCPCLDCETTQVKEYLSNPPYACSNHSCPANTKGPIKCDSAECPSNRVKSSGNTSMVCSDKACSNDAAAVRNQMKPRPRSGSPPRSDKSPVQQQKKPTKKVIGKTIPSNASGSCQNPKCKNSNSSICGEESGSPQRQASMVNALQEMCSTVGTLSVQIKELMTKINKLT